MDVEDKNADVYKSFDFQNDDILFITVEQNMYIFAVPISSTILVSPKLCPVTKVITHTKLASFINKF